MRTPGAPDVADPRHSKPRLGQPAGTIAVVILEDAPGTGVDDDRHAEGRGHCVDSDVVVGRPDPAGRE